ncbi:E3 SUMO-protein ligase NSE2-like [Acanthaster planci]|uniref:E3 SUMO-protein ligase NSE2 n=1 Tax=Acanthaster planci TaxID=133434 RepID=A0A8B7ZE37_ACAPL|nr:E3 SUMO-protein ligase NSE2-like [Acanthaster planci]
MSGIANLGMVDGALQSVDKVQSYITIGMEDIIEVSLDLAETATEGDGTETQLEDLKKMMEEYASMEQDLHQYVKAVKQVKGQIQRLGIEEQMKVEVSQLVRQAVADIQKKDDDGQLGRHSKMDELIQKMWQYRNAGDSIPTTSNAQGDDDVIMTQCEVTTVCPITRCEMTDPVTNRHCQHNYERAAIMQIVKNRKNAKCPVTGCGNQIPITKSDLVDNRQLKRFIEHRNRQENRS